MAVVAAVTEMVLSAATPIKRRRNLLLALKICMNVVQVTLWLKESTAHTWQTNIAALLAWHTLNMLEDFVIKTNIN